MAVDRVRRLLLLPASLCVALSLTGCTSGTTAASPAVPDTVSSVNGTWTGSASDSSGAGTLTLSLTQSGASVSGTVTATASANGQPVTGRGTVTGSVSGTTFT